MQVATLSVTAVSWQQLRLAKVFASELFSPALDLAPTFSKSDSKIALYVGGALGFSKGWESVSK